MERLEGCTFERWILVSSVLFLGDIMRLLLGFVDCIRSHLRIILECLSSQSMGQYNV